MSKKPNLSDADRATLSPRERERRTRIANEKMALRVEGTDLYKLVKRIELTVEGVNKAFGCDAWYCKEEASGEVFWPETWQKDLQPSTEQNPWRYLVVERDHFPRFDQKRDPMAYEGGSKIWAENVPYECEAGSLVCWVLGVLEATLPHIVKQREKCKMQLEKFQAANSEYMACAKQAAQDDAEEDYKQLLLGQLKTVSDRDQKRLKAAQAALAELVSELGTEGGVIAEPMLREPSESKALWQLTFGRTDRADWCMACGDDDRPGAGSSGGTSQYKAVRLSQPGGGVGPFCLQPTDEGLRDPREVAGELEMRDVMFKRFRHGVGKERRAKFVVPDLEEVGGDGEDEDEDGEDDESDSDDDEGVAAEKREAKAAKAARRFESLKRQPGHGNVVHEYQGGFQYGARHGEDTATVTFFYTLLGDYYQGTPVVAHELLYANGDRYRGSTAATYSNGRPAADLTTVFGSGDDDEYEAIRYDNTPVPNGQGTMIFADGSTYVGEFKAGRLHGLGRYVGRSGEVVEGQFVGGVLHGPGRSEVLSKWSHSSSQEESHQLDGQSGVDVGNGSGVGGGGGVNTGAAGGQGQSSMGDVTETGVFDRGLLQGQGLRLFKDKFLHEGHFEKGELHQYGRVDTPSLRYAGWLEHGTPNDHGVCEFGESRRLYNPFTKATVETPRFTCEGAWLCGSPLGRMSCVREKVFPRTPGEVERKEALKKEREETKAEDKKVALLCASGMSREKARETSKADSQKSKGKGSSSGGKVEKMDPSVTQFCFQCDGIHSLRRRLAREAKRASKVNAKQYQRTLDARAKHKKTVDRNNQTKFLSNVAKILMDPHLDDHFGSDLGFEEEDSDEDYGAVKVPRNKKAEAENKKKKKLPLKQKTKAPGGYVNEQVSMLTALAGDANNAGSAIS